MSCRRTRAVVDFAEPCSPWRTGLRQVNDSPGAAPAHRPVHRPATRSPTQRARPHDLRERRLGGQPRQPLEACRQALRRPLPLSTGGGFTTRELYSDEDESLLDAQRPVIVNGVEELATRSDLLDRSLLVQLPTILPGNRLAEHNFWAASEQARPRILGALYDAVAGALANVGRPSSNGLPRMADFAPLGDCCRAGTRLGDTQLHRRIRAQPRPGHTSSRSKRT